MLKVALWLVLSLFSGSGVIIYALQQQYEEQSVTYRILYREVTVKLSQLETVLSLLSVSSDPAIVQQNSRRLWHGNVCHRHSQSRL